MSDGSARADAAGRVVVITGGLGGLGRSVVPWFVAAGASVHVVEAAAAGPAELERHFGAGAEQVRFHQADVTDQASVSRVFADVRDEGGRLDVLANLVGGFAYAPLEETDAALWAKMLNLNATSAFLCCRAAVPYMRERGWGRIVNVAAGPAVNRGAENMSAYAAAKAAVLNLTESLAKELVRSGVTVNAIVPSIIDTAQNRAAMPDADTSVWLDPAAIAAVIGFLAGDAAGIVTGTAVTLTRG